jgi:hypothetical protein
MEATYPLGLSREASLERRGRYTMSMQVFSARVQNGTIVPEDGVTLPEGSKVTVIADGEDHAFEATAEEESELLEAIAEADRGDVISAAELFHRLSR